MLIVRLFDTNTSGGELPKMFRANPPADCCAMFPTPRVPRPCIAEDPVQRHQSEPLALETTSLLYARINCKGRPLLRVHFHRFTPQCNRLGHNRRQQFSDRIGEHTNFNLCT